MKKKKVWRYYCEFCKKSGCSGGHLKKHEERCTLNPNRTCGYCRLLEQEQPDLSEALKILPEPKFEETEFGGRYFAPTFVQAVKESLPKLRDFVGNCPACIMAALRQKGIPVPLVDGFNFKKEGEEIWAEFNASQLRA